MTENATEPTGEKTEAKRPSSLTKRAFKGLLVMFALLLTAIILANYVFFAPVLRFILNSVESKTGVSVTFEKASGNFFTGKIKIEDCTIQRQNHPESNFNLKGEWVMAEFYVRELLSGTAAIKFLEVNTLNGSLELVGKPKKQEKRQNFRIDQTAILNSQINFIDRTIEKPFQANLEINMNIGTISSSLSHNYTTFFKDDTSVVGKINNALFVRAAKEGKAICQIETVPINLFAPYINLLECFNTGSVNIKMADKTDASGQKMRMSITLNKDCTVKMPEKMFEPAIQLAFQELERSDNAPLRDIQTKLEKLHVQIETADKYMATALRLPGLEDLRKKYNELKAKHEELRTKLELLKATVLTDTLNRFLQSGIPIELDLLIVDEEIHLDMDSTFTNMLEKTYVDYLKNYSANVNLLLDIVTQFSGEGKNIEQPLNKIKDLLRF